jgi:hypothetical protein
VRTRDRPHQEPNPTSSGSLRFVMLQAPFAAVRRKIVPTARPTNPAARALPKLLHRETRRPVPRRFRSRENTQIAIQYQPHLLDLNVINRENEKDAASTTSRQAGLRCSGEMYRGVTIPCHKQRQSHQADQAISGNQSRCVFVDHRSSPFPIGAPNPGSPSIPSKLKLNSPLQASQKTSGLGS